MLLYAPLSTINCKLKLKIFSGMELLALSGCLTSQGATEEMKVCPAGFCPAV